MKRVADRRAIALLCPSCHSLHRTAPAPDVRIDGYYLPVVLNSHVLWAKMMRDPEHWDPDQLAIWWRGNLPVPEHPAELYLTEYQIRRGSL